MVPSYVFTGVGGYYASKQGGLAGVFRCAIDDTNWKHALSEIEAFTVFVHPRDPNLVFVGTADGVYRSTDRGQNFRRADFPDRGVQVWSFLHDDTDPKLMLAGGSPVSIYRSEDGGASWKRMPDPHLPVHPRCRFPAANHGSTIVSTRVLQHIPPKSGHWNSAAQCPLCAKSRHSALRKKCRYSIPLPSRQRDAAGFKTRGALDIERPKDRLLFAVGRNQVYSAFSAWRRAVGVCRYGPHAGPPTSARADP